MPKVSIYLPDVLYDEVRKHEISVSAVAQRALEEAVGHRANAHWVDRARSRPPRTRRTIDTAALLDEVRGEFGS